MRISDGQDSVWAALEELYHDREVDVVPGIGSDTDPAFELTDKGEESALTLLAESDEAVMFLVKTAIRHADEPLSEELVARVIAQLAPRLRDDAGVNLLRVLRRQDPPWFNTAGLSAEEVAKFDP
jgi:hypothetical protein